MVRVEENKKQIIKLCSQKQNDEYMQTYWLKLLNVWHAINPQFPLTSIYVLQDNVMNYIDDAIAG